MKGEVININPFEGFNVAQINDVNGFDAERKAASLLTMACNMRVSWASRKEDDSKVDLICTYINPNIKNHVNTVLTQIKSGNTYASIKNISEQDFLKVKTSQFKDYLKRPHPTLVVWIDNVNEKFYWFVVKNGADTIRKLYDSTHIISPCLRFDLNRILSSFTSKNGGKGLMFSSNSNQINIDQRYSDTDKKDLFQKAKGIYLSLKGNDIYSELFGNIQITKKGWRHITRFGRRNNHKLASYEIIKLLPLLLSKSPSKHRIQFHREENDKTTNYRKMVYLCEYNDVKLHLQKSDVILDTTVYIKVTEVIAYPKNWDLISKLTEALKRRVYFKSIYYKLR